MKFKNLFKRTKDDYKEAPISERYNENWIHERMDEGPPSGKGGFDFWQLFDWMITLLKSWKK